MAGLKFEGEDNGYFNVQFKEINTANIVVIIIDGSTSITKVGLLPDELKQLRDFIDIQLEQYESRTNGN